MELKPAEVAMLRQLMYICRQDNMDLYIDDIQTFNAFHARLRNFKRPKLKKSEQLTSQGSHLVSKNEKKIKGKKTKYWHRRNRHKNKQSMKKGLNSDG